jgi:hypothetical protein
MLIYSTQQGGLMKKYTIIFDKNKFYLKEIKTGYLLKKWLDKKAAWNLANKLNKRGAFEGETPYFFALKVPIHLA